MCIAGSITPRLHTFHVYGSSSRPTYFVPNPTPNEANAAGHRGLLLGHALSSLRPPLLSLSPSCRELSFGAKRDDPSERARVRSLLLVGITWESHSLLGNGKCAPAGRRMEAGCGGWCTSQRGSACWIEGGCCCGGRFRGSCRGRRRSQSVGGASEAVAAAAAVLSSLVFVLLTTKTGRTTASNNKRGGVAHCANSLAVASQFGFGINNIELCC